MVESSQKGELFLPMRLGLILMAVVQALQNKSCYWKCICTRRYSVDSPFKALQEVWIQCSKRNGELRLQSGLAQRRPCSGGIHDFPQRRPCSGGIHDFPQRRPYSGGIHDLPPRRPCSGGYSRPFTTTPLQRWYSWPSTVTPLQRWYSWPSTATPLHYCDESFFLDQNSRPIIYMPSMAVLGFQFWEPLERWLYEGGGAVIENHPIMGHSMKRRYEYVTTKTSAL